MRRRRAKEGLPIRAATDRTPDENRTAERVDGSLLKEESNSPGAVYPWSKTLLTLT
jgi:hypothetical protein